MAPKSYDPPFDLQRSPNVVVKMANLTFDDPCRSNGGSYDFGAMETFVQHAKIYKYTDFHPNPTDADFPIGDLPCPLDITRNGRPIHSAFNKPKVVGSNPAETGGFFGYEHYRIAIVLLHVKEPSYITGWANPGNAGKVSLRRRTLTLVVSH